ncbi:peptidoglycan recognition family protein [Candidatus Chlorohelix sp.]|uniref:peptidoglycan recognition family protein n=1 Tax=Candidatus Chlorohelix sp. TaxID=3139201 RepID=UPI00301FE24F
MPSDSDAPTNQPAQPNSDTTSIADNQTQLNATPSDGDTDSIATFGAYSDGVVFLLPPDNNQNLRPRMEHDKQGEPDSAEGLLADGIFPEDNGSASTDPNNLQESVEAANTDSGSVGAFSAGGSAFDIMFKVSPNCWQGRNGLTAIAIVDHIMQGTLDATTSWFMNPSAEASTHFGVGKDGRIIQYVRLENSAWGNGPVNKPDPNIEWLADAISKGINPNRLTVSIEHEGKTGEAFTETMYQATFFLHKQIIRQLNIPVDRHHIIGHYQIDSVNRPLCPGKGFPWDRLMADLKAEFSQPATQPLGDPPGYTEVPFGPGAVAFNNSYVRAYPSFDSSIGTVQRKLPKDTSLHFDGYTDQGPAFQGSARWYKISQQDGGGWIHARMIG